MREWRVRGPWEVRRERHETRLRSVVLLATHVTLGLHGLVCACDQEASHVEEGVVPLARDDQHRPRVWASCPDEIAIQVDPRVVRQKAVRIALESAIAAWRLPHLPLIRLQIAEGRRPNEDGVSSLTFSSPPECSTQRVGPGMGCFVGDALGLTQLYGRPRGAYFETVEADIFLARSLLNEPSLMERVLVHELGHFFGLDHPSNSIRPSTTVMGTAPSFGRPVPGEADLRTLKVVYGTLCGTPR